MNGMQLPYGYSWTFGRWEQQRQERSQEFLVNLLLALLLVFAVMAALFESVRQAIALMIALPFALAGAVWTLYITGTDFDSPGAVGLLLLIGIVVNNGIVMIEHINGYRRQGMPRYDAMIKGGRERLRPILMTAITTLISLVPDGDPAPGARRRLLLLDGDRHHGRAFRVDLPHLDPASDEHDSRRGLVRHRPARRRWPSAAAFAVCSRAAGGSPETAARPACRYLFTPRRTSGHERGTTRRARVRRVLAGVSGVAQKMRDEETREREE